MASGAGREIKKERKSAGGSYTRRVYKARKQKLGVLEEELREEEKAIGLGSRKREKNGKDQRAGNGG